MSTLTSLFGGLVLVLLLYTAGAWIKNLPTALRAALASGLPLIGYFVYLAGRWPGLDVIAMHIAVFLVAGLMLYMFTQYRRRSGGRMHWVPRVLIGFFVLLAAINAALLYVSTRGLPPALAQRWLPRGEGVNSGFSGIVTHGQDAAKAVTSELKRAYSAAQLGWRIQIDGLPQHTAQTRQHVTMNVVDRSGLPVGQLDAELRVLRPGAADAHPPIRLLPVTVGVYSNVLELPDSGRWIVEIRLRRDAQLVYAESREVYLP